MNLPEHKKILGKEEAYKTLKNLALTHPETADAVYSHLGINKEAFEAEKESIYDIGVTAFLAQCSADNRINGIASSQVTWLDKSKDYASNY